MTRLGWVLLSIALIVLVAIIGFFVWHRAGVELPPASETSQATTTPDVNPSTLSIYTNGEYGFSFFYASSATLMDAYTDTPLTGVPWRNAATATGTAIVQISQNTEMLRVGMSTNANAVKNCTLPGAAETSAGTQDIGGTDWNVFTFKKVGTDNEQQVTSYRTIHKSSCYTLEVFQPLNTAASSTGYTSKDTVTSFSFAT